MCERKMWYVLLGEEGGLDASGTEPGLAQRSGGAGEGRAARKQASGGGRGVEEGYFGGVGDWQNLGPGAVQGSLAHDVTAEPRSDVLPPPPPTTRHLSVTALHSVPR